MYMLSFRYRAYPSRKQVLRLNRQMQLAKELYNMVFDETRKQYKRTRKTYSKSDMITYITRLKKDYPRFKELHSQVAQNISKRLSSAYNSFFIRLKRNRNSEKVKVGFPRIKTFVRSLTYPQYGFGFKSDKRLHLSKIGNIPIVIHRIPKGKIKTCVIKQYPSGKWFVGFSTELPEKAFESNGKDAIGIDVGLINFAAFSNGQTIDPPKFLRKSESRLKLLNRRVSRKKKGSKNRRKARVRFAKLAEKVSNQRFDFLHKLSRRQVDSYGLIAVEKLNVQNMQKNHHFAKSISDASWSTYRQMLAYKAQSAGCKLVEVAPKDTTKTCSHCGSKQDLALSERVYNCPVCKHVEDRDVNAAKNILAKGTAGRAGTNACGKITPTLEDVMNPEQVASMKQELDGGVCT